MTTDVKIRWSDELQTGDFLFVDNDLDTDEGLATSVLISLFTDQRALDDDPIPNVGLTDSNIDKRGWWGDLAVPESEGDQIGSKLWLLDRGVITQNDLKRAETYAYESIEWLIDDGIAKEINVIAQKEKFESSYIVILQVEIIRVDGTKTNFTFDPEWTSTILED